MTRPAPDAAAEIARSLGLTQERIDLRAAAIGLTAADRSRLRRAAEGLGDRIDTVIDGLYERFLAHPETASFLGSSERVARLRRAQRAYLETLLHSAVDEDYVLGRLRIGVAHHRVQLSPQWYLASYAHIVVGHVDRLLESAATRAEGIDAVLALLRSVMLDATLVLDAYGASEEAEILASRGAPDAGGPETGDAPGAADGSPASRRPRRRSVTQLELTSDIVASRRSFVDITAGDLAVVRALAPLVVGAMPSILDEFYGFFSSSPETSGLVPAGAVARLKQQVASYWQELVVSEVDRPYAVSRTRIGVVHSRVGLAPQWYLAGLARQLCGLIRVIAAARDDVADCIKALVKLVFFDVAFVIDAYMDARAESLLRLEGYADRLVAGLSAAVAVVDEQRRIVSANGALLDMLGIDGGLLYRMELAAAVQLPGLAELVARAGAAPRGRAVERSTVGEREYRITAIGLDPSDGLGERLTAVVFDDITALLGVSNEVERTDDRFERLLESTGAVVWEMDAVNATVTAISSSVLELTGFRDLHFLGRVGAWIGRVVPADQDRLQQTLDALTDEEPAELEHRLIRADGREIWVLSRVRRTDGAGGARFVGVTIDVTRAKDTERLRTEAVGQLAGGIAHVLNNALTSVMGNLELEVATRGGRSESPRIEAAMAESRRAAEVTAQLLSFAGRQMLQPTELVLGDVVRELGPRLQELVGDQIRLELRNDAAPWACRVDRSLLERSLVSLVRNAAEAIEGPGEVVVSTRNAHERDPLTGVPREWSELVVLDTGRGMPRDLGISVVEPFVSTKPPSDGAGLGLSQAYGFALQSGGSLDIESSAGHGTAIRLRFPRLLTGGAPRLPALTGGEQPLAVVVEDDAGVRDVAVAVLVELGYAVEEAGSAHEALDLLVRRHPDVMLIDVLLGDGPDGLTLARLVGETAPGVRIVITSGYAAENFELGGLPEGTPFLAKPFALASLREAVDRARLPRA